MPMCKELGANRFEWDVKVRSGFSSKLIGTNVTIIIPVPDHTSKATILVTKGKAKYDPGLKALVSVGVTRSPKSQLCHCARRFLMRRK